ncbi:MAG: hypothetical protein AAB858_00525 [Patescibacteria group bacterium]|mgnify:FL=1
MKKIIYIGTLALFPTVAFGARFNNLADLFNFFTNLINQAVIPLFVALAFVWFLWGIVMFVKNATDETKRKEGKQFMIWAVIALFVMISVWGLVGVLTNIFDIRVGLPRFPTGGYTPSSDCVARYGAADCAAYGSAGF